MENQEFVLKNLFQRELCAITFLKEYVQFNFDGPVFNFYEFPMVGAEGNWSSSVDPGYFDRVCKLIGAKLVSVKEVPDTSLNLGFENGISVELSLREEDRSTAEAAMLQAGDGNGWLVW